MALEEVKDFHNIKKPFYLQPFKISQQSLGWVDNGDFIMEESEGSDGQLLYVQFLNTTMN